jgi:NAD(P)-dependent dehydrogenase (short-subunit alcohol dehydrogenase family)
MNLNLQNKVFIVTGGAAGIGEAISLSALGEGALVAIVGRGELENYPINKVLNDQYPNRFLYIKTELTDAAQCQQAIDATVKKFGSIYCLVNNAGANDGIGLENGNPDKFSHSLHQNLVHYYTMAHYALPFLKQSQGNIVNISSKAAVTGQGGTSGYVAAKGAQLALTREWAVELLPFQVRVNAVIPAEVLTPLYKKWIQTFDNPAEKIQNITKNIPLGKRFTEPEEIAYAAIFLSSDKALHITGQHWFVDGGYTHLDRVI